MNFDNVKYVLGMVRDYSPSAELRQEYGTALSWLELAEAISSDEMPIPPETGRSGSMEEQHNLEEQLAELELIEIVQVVRRPESAEVQVDGGESHPDTVVALLVQGLVRYVIDEMYEFTYIDDGHEYEEDDDEDEEPELG